MSVNTQKRVPAEAPGTGFEPTTDTSARREERIQIWEESVALASKYWEHKEKDRDQDEPSVSDFPACSKARTTFHARDVDDWESEQKFDRFWCLQHGRQHRAERRSNGYSEGWDGQKVRQETVADYLYGTTILVRAGVPQLVRKQAVERALKTNLNGFNRYYGGFEGATFGFAFLYNYDTPEQAKKSYLVDEADKWIDANSERFTVERLIDFVWNKHGGGRE